MITRELFKSKLSALIEQAQEEYVLDLRASRSPYDAWDDNEVFTINELDEVYDYIKDSDEWYVDIYENVPDDRGGCAYYLGESLVSWEE